MRVVPNVGGLAGFGSQPGSVPDRGAVHAKHRGRKGSNSKRRRGVQLKRGKGA